jgi:hypothetical protein
LVTHFLTELELIVLWDSYIDQFGLMRISSA